MDIRILRAGDEDVLARVAPDLFDNAVDPALAAEFLSDPRHHIAVAIDTGVAVAFASGVDYVHPDKPRELWINEMSVARTHRERGLGKAVLRALLDHARAMGCANAWVLTHHTNEPAKKLYASLEGKTMEDGILGFEFDFK
jgi:ribosomal protein S18 acetylase RimI-like enzyme